MGYGGSKRSEIDSGIDTIRNTDSSRHASGNSSMKVTIDEEDITLALDNNAEMGGSLVSKNTGNANPSPNCQEKIKPAPASYNNTLLGINGAKYEISSDDPDMWKEDVSTDFEDSQHEEEEMTDPLCPHINITYEERLNLYRPWRKAVIIKLLGRRTEYRFLYGRLAKLWNLGGNFELIDLQNEFFVVRFAEMTDYEKVMYNGPWTILGHYLTIQRWKLEFRPFEESIKRIIVWIRIPDLPIEYYEKHFLWKVGDKIGKTLKVDVHTIKENQVGGEMNSTARGRFARISVELNLEKKLVPRIKIRNRTYLIEYEVLHLICLQFYKCSTSYSFFVVTVFT